MKPVDIIAIILTATVCYLLAMVLTVAAIRNQPLSITGAEIVDKMTIALIAILAHYMGKRQK
jgi:hypothetical protein